MISRTARRGRGANTVSTGRLPIIPIGSWWGRSARRRCQGLCWIFSSSTRTSRSADEHTEKEEEATVSLTALVLKETMCDSVWAYALKSKSVAEDTWIAE